MRRYRVFVALLPLAILAGCQASGNSAGVTEKAAAVLPAPRPEPVTIPEGTLLPLVLETALSSATNSAGDRVEARLAEDVRVGERVVVPAGSEVRGQVTAAKGSGRVKGRARLAFDFDTLVVKGKEHSIGTRAVDISARNSHKRDGIIIGSGTGAGAIIGAIVDGKKGAGIGALIGAGTGTGVVLTTKGKEVALHSGARLNVKLTREARL